MNVSFVLSMNGYAFQVVLSVKNTSYVVTQGRIRTLACSCFNLKIKKTRFFLPAVLQICAKYSFELSNVVPIVWKLVNKMSYDVRVKSN